jgi:oligopeptide transport system substrate-binding protein
MSGRGDAPAYSLIPEGTMGYKSGDLFKEDVEVAKKLLAEAGFSDAAGVRQLTLLYNTSEGIRFIAESTQETFRNTLGLDLTLENEEWKVFVVSRRNGRFDIARGGWEGDYNDATTFLNLFKSNDPNSHGGLHNQEFDRLLELASKDRKN